MHEFEDTDNLNLLLSAYPGHVSVMKNITSEGAGYGWFLTLLAYLTTSRRAHLKTARPCGHSCAGEAYVIKDPTFGLTGLGCRVSPSSDAIAVTPTTRCGTLPARNG
jgi:hypothetical protein